MSLFGSKYLKYQHTPSEFLPWLRYANAGMLQEGNIASMEFAIKNLPSDDPLIEIGSFCGLSTNVMSYYLENDGKSNKLVTCDKWIFEGAEKDNELIAGSAVTHKLYKDYVKNSFIHNLSFFSPKRLDRIFTIEEFSDDFFKLWSERAIVKDVFNKEIELGGNISFAYIDGNHTYGFAKRDFINTDKYLNVGGFILFDDSSKKAKFEVYDVVKEVLGSKQYEVVIRNPNFLLRKLK